MNGLEFTDEVARQLEKVYLTRDVIAQRLETIRHLRLSRGERVLDIGCGPGFLCESMAEIVGPDGAVVGIDISTDLITLCNRRKTSTWVSYEIGDATKLSQSDASFDAVVCTQVAEYVADVDRVFSGTFRVLKPNGRMVCSCPSKCEAHQIGHAREDRIAQGETPDIAGVIRSVEGLREGLRELGYVEGHNIKYEYRRRGQ